MTDQHRTTSTPDDAPSRPETRPVRELQVEDAPLKQEGDALRDGSGSRHGQSPPNVDRTERT